MKILPKPGPIREVGGVDRRLLDDEIRRSGQPAVFRGLCENWPAVRAARTSDETLIGYLKSMSAARKVSAIVGQPDIRGRFFYTDDMRGLNFERGVSAIDPFLDRLLRDRDNPAPIAMAVQSELIGDFLPGFEQENRVSLLADVPARAWIGNRIRVAAHYDLYENIGVVVAGRRRFTLFPPEQIGNLYTGPLELTPAGTPISLVDLANPDLERFPRFVEAAQTALSAELEPGDAIYIPFHWWHAVDSLEPLNFFVNYWWSDAPANIGNAYDALMYAFYALKPLPPEQRAVWRSMFDHYVFCTGGDPGEHLPPHARGVLGAPTPEMLERMRATLKHIAASL